MVSAAKLKRAQDRVVSARPFANKMMEVLSELATQSGDNFSHPLLDARGDKKYLIVLVTADKGLCGGFNANLIKAAQSFMKEHSDAEIEMMPVGRKGRDFFSRRNVKFAQEFIGLTGKGRVDYSEAMEVAQEVIKRFTEDETIDKVFLIYSEFKTVLSQRAVVDQILPVARTVGDSDDEGSSSTVVNSVDYIYEQPPEQIFGSLLPKLIESQIYRAMLESVASEQGSRMTAMDSATKNAGDLISNLTLTMNRIRQAAITKEIIEVVSGSAASK